MKIMVINGGARAMSRTRELTKAFEQALTKKGVEILPFDVGKDMLPVYTGSEAEMETATVKKLITFAEQADAFIICTPEYHGSMSGALKNALDFLGGKQFKGKPAIIGAAAGGGKGGINALNSLRQVLRGLYTLALPDQIVVDPEHFDENLRLVNQDALERIEAMTDELLRITRCVGRREEAAAK
ncbi:NAD(P)H-dependent oxidoreductase [Brevibacillus sp. SYP-B805]|uniref:NADPH-dependent FMN reductase n=1 Tax=Brevibacillus sp. SYP-B805 TaxID=1578199 RepID=UPI0013EBFB46|nr:NADPH-dependent FMN reductase [Brevibacillus sp. SYP-B805]NGQ97457.1 NAD(P)H-dependent oxidoreductase [Brevibacillus sp. SYP-B805]